MTDYDLSLLAEIETPTAGGGNFVSVGRIWMDGLKATRWDVDKFVKRDYEPGTPKAPDEFIEYALHQDCDELNENMRKKLWFVAERLSGNRKNQKQDWGEIILPAILSVFGDRGKYYKALVDKQFVAIEDVPTGKTRKGTDKKTGEEREYDVTAPKFIKAFKTEIDARAFIAEKFGDKSNGKVPVELINKVRGLLKSAKGDASKVTTWIQDDPAEFDNRDAEELIRLAQA